MKNQPKIIYLQADGDPDTDFNQLTEVTWAQVDCLGGDLEYIQIEEYNILKEENARLRTELEKIEAYCARHEFNAVACMVRDAANKALQQEVS